MLLNIGTARRLVALLACAILLASCGGREAPVEPRPAPVSTPATAAGRVEAHFETVGESLFFMKRWIDGTEKDWPPSREQILFLGIALQVVYEDLQNLDVPPDSEFEREGYNGSVADAHKLMLELLQPCRAMGARAGLEESNDSILEAYYPCRDAVYRYYKEAPHLFPDASEVD